MSNHLYRPDHGDGRSQIEVINSLIAQKVDAIAVSANDADALVPALKKAMDRGIKVISWDSGVAKDGRRCTSTHRPTR
jgi:rhamnose transport system substrate-binding protein